MTFRCQFLVALVGAAFALPAFAHDYKVGTLEISHPWTRATAPTAKAGGGYLVITNKGTTPDRLVAAQSTASQKVEIHEMKMDGSVMVKPGGYHIMFMELKAPLAKDTKVPVTLVFEKAGKIDVDFAVQAAGSGEPMKH